MLTFGKNDPKLNSRPFYCLRLYSKGPSINYVVSRGEGGQKSLILKQHSLWTAPNIKIKLWVFGSEEKNALVIHKKSTPIPIVEKLRVLSYICMSIFSCNSRSVRTLICVLWGCSSDPVPEYVVWQIQSWLPFPHTNELLWNNRPSTWRGGLPPQTRRHISPSIKVIHPKHYKNLK